MIKELMADGKRRMESAVEALRSEFNTVRTGRASTGLLDRLEQRGLVARREVAADRRAYNVVLTPAGTRLLREILPAYYQGTPLRSGGAPILDMAPPAGVTPERQRANLDLLARWCTGHRALQSRPGRGEGTRSFEPESAGESRPHAARRVDAAHQAALHRRRADSRAHAAQRPL